MPANKRVNYYKDLIKPTLEEMKGQTPEELNFNYDRVELMEVAKKLKIKNRSKVSKIVLCLLIEMELEGLNRG